MQVQISNLSWQERAKEIYKFHYNHVESNPNWTRTNTAETLGLRLQVITRNLKVASNLSDPHVLNCKTLTEASRKLDERIDNALAQLVAARPTQCQIINANFLSWLSEYSGPKFNLIHCDFPLESPSEFIFLLSNLISSAPRFISVSSHLLIWFTWEYYSQIIRQVNRIRNIQFHAPLIWHKPNSTVNSYECCLVFSCGQRPIANDKSLSYSCPQHRNEMKSEMMLRHFFSLFIDSTTRLLDPTCGNGSAIRAARALRAKSALGVESDKTLAATAKDLLKI